MGWFSSLFSKDTGPKTAYIGVNELQQWFDSKSEPLVEGIRQGIKEDFEGISESISGIKDAARALDGAKLQNDKIPERALQVMQGNRKAYITSVINFADRIQQPSAINFSTVSEFVSDFEDNITLFTKSSARNYYVLQEFFAHESGRIAQHIKDIDVTVRSMMDNGYRKINALSQNIQKINGLLKKKETGEILLAEQEKERDELVHSIEKYSAEMESLKGTKDYRMLKEAERRRDELSRQIKETERRLSELFSPLDRPMRKFAKISADGEDLLKAYMESPLKALSEDSDMRILDALERMKASLEKGELELKDKAKEKALEQLVMINRQGLQAILNTYRSLQENHSDNERGLKMNMVTHRQNELSYKLNHMKDKLGKLEQNISKIGKFLEMAELKEAVEAVRKDSLEVFNTDLRIRIGDEISARKAEEQAAVEKG